MSDDRFPRPFGKYQLLRKLAQGGMAEIFLARDPDGQICAIKRILPHLAHEESFIRMFIDEARIVSHIDHPNVAGVYEQDKAEGFYYIAMEFVQGHSLLALSQKAKSTRMDLPRGLLAFVAAELLSGLGSAHAARDGKGRHLGIVHRDVTPQNVLISYDGEVKLVDFGVAKARARLTQTEAGFTKGKLAYMSPEQARGEDLDGRSDLFSVGIILHEITTNGRLFDKEGPGGILGAIVNDPIPTPSSKSKGYPPELERIVMRALDKEVGRRFQTAEDMRAELMRYARRERPNPSQRRLSELVHDLFGPPDSEADIQRAQDLDAATPPEVAALAESSIVDSRESPPREETRMLHAGVVDIREKSSVRVASTNPRAEAAGSRIAEAEPVVPEPFEPLRLRLARFLRDLSLDLRISLRDRRSSWLKGAGLVLAALVLLGVAMSGVPTAVFHALADATASDPAPEPEVPVVEAPPPVPMGATRLRLVSEPPGASILIDGLGVGAVTPHWIEQPPIGRSFEVELRLDGYRPRSEKLRLGPAEGDRRERFELTAQQGVLEVSSDPPGAQIYIDGERSGQRTPATLEGFPAGRPVQIGLRAKGRIAQQAAVLVPDRGTQALRLTLPVDRDQIPSGAVQVSSRPSGCPVALDGSPVGVTPTVDLPARPGTREVSVRCDNHAPEVRLVTVMSGQTSKVSVSPNPTRFGYLTVRTVPAKGVSIRINGRKVKTPVEYIEVVPGRHRVTARHDRLDAERTIVVDVEADARVRRTINLTY